MRASVALRSFLFFACASAVACTGILGSFEVADSTSNIDGAVTPTGDTGPGPGPGPGGEDGSVNLPDGAMCAAPKVACGKDCADLSNDAKHCGKCGRECGGSTCEMGNCKPQKLYDAPGEEIISLDPALTEVVFTAGKAVRSCPKTGCVAGTPPKVIGAPADSVFRVRAVGNAAVFTAGTTKFGEDLYVCPLTGCPLGVTPVQSDRNAFFETLSTNGNELAFSSPALTITVMRCNNGTCNVNTTTNRKSNGGRYVLGSNHVYGVANSFPDPPIFRCAIGVSPCTPETILTSVSGLENITAMAFGSGNLLFANGGRIAMCDSNACGATVKTITNAGAQVTDLIAGPNRAYWLKVGSSTIEHCALPACNPVASIPLTQGATPVSLRADDKFLYWAEKGALWRVLQP